MELDHIKALTETFEANAQMTEAGVEYWLARDLQHLLGYSEWRNFMLVISKAKTACEPSGNAILDHFVDVNKMVDLGSGSKREIDDIMLTRYFIEQTCENHDFSTEITIFDARQHGMRSESDISNEHLVNNRAVRATLLERGIRPETLPAAEDVKKMERRLSSDEKKSHQKPESLSGLGDE